MLLDQFKYFKQILQLVYYHHYHFDKQNYLHSNMKPFSTIGFDVIRKSPTNNSTSKNACAFSKQKRFPDPNPQCKNACYIKDDQMSQLSKRGASFGSGKKSDFTKPLTCSPPSTLYMYKSVFEDGKNRGKSFGASRDRSPDRSYFIPQIHKNPGPGNYENQVETRMKQKYSIRPKTKDFIEQNLTYKKSPAPGQYNDIDLDPKTGRFAVAKFGDSKFGRINPKTPRFEAIKDGPGPSSYLEGDSMSTGGKYTLSQHRGQGTRAFSKTARMTFTDEFKIKATKAPGPGDYESPTEFGTYGDSKYYQTMKDFSTIN